MVCVWRPGSRLNCGVCMETRILTELWCVHALRSRTEITYKHDFVFKQVRISFNSLSVCQCSDRVLQHLLQRRQGRARRSITEGGEEGEAEVRRRNVKLTDPVQSKALVQAIHSTNGGGVSEIRRMARDRSYTAGLGLNSLLYPKMY